MQTRFLHLLAPENRILINALDLEMGSFFGGVYPGTHGRVDPGDQNYRQLLAFENVKVKERASY